MTPGELGAVLDQARRVLQNQQHQFRQTALDALWEAHEATAAAVSAAAEATAAAESATEESQRAREAVNVCIAKLNELLG